MKLNRKEQLLDKKTDKKIRKCLQAQQEWIQMQNLNNQGLRPDYLILDDQQINISLGVKKRNHKKQKQVVLSSQPIYPISSQNNKPNSIKMNGLVFQKQGVQTRSTKPKIPQMQVVCQQCGLKQSVPANSQAFICHQCEAASECSPKYGIFICGNCQGKVWYTYGASSMIRCTKCGTINNVPLCPNLKNKDIKPKRKNIKIKQPQQSYQQIISQNLQEKYLEYPNIK